MFIVGDLEGGVIIDQYNKPGESVFGHPVVPKVFAVGAIDALDSGHDTIEPYSSQGPARIDFPSLQNRRKPDITGIDNVRVSGAGGFPTRFPGTSAAAPHIAGIAALLKQRFISAKPARLKEALESSAVDLGAVGPDNVFGWGRADATAAFAVLKDALGKSMPWLQLLLVE